MIVRELISELSLYPDNMKITSINAVFVNCLGELTLTHEDTPQEIISQKAMIEELDRQRQDRMNSLSEITSFANRW